MWTGVGRQDMNCSPDIIHWTVWSLKGLSTARRGGGPRVSVFWGTGRVYEDMLAATLGRDERDMRVSGEAHDCLELIVALVVPTGGLHESLCTPCLCYAVAGASLPCEDTVEHG